MSVELRAATLDDLDDVMALETSTFTTDAWSRESMAAELSSAHCRYVVAVDDDGAFAGYGGVLVPAGSKDADIQTIAVAPERRGTGLGRRLMERLLAEAVDRGAREVFLEVRADNPVAQALYLSLGFEQIAVRPRYYQPDGVDALVMRASLRPSRSGVGAGGLTEEDIR
ncbi:ribosomal protein S18-alanine N-acetyltransferase [Cnuibacter physcomitrellae]|uniref:ribosomal protein S18-alanine N-acetyltransferase n=1 Tax=Cnuibacter physcomitrellae TaxID=1619308 RepID=UPI002175C2DF|nr:ribosomal protein S18-alanine N-acetyltransferase [Cnuibacter physcomitrellae]MCS5499236.1 ribosomal protein S18-alanine N-acetyltransferase [Cnuibacter physcomitrellae]